MIGGLLSSFDLSQRNAGIHGGIVKHTAEVRFGHKMTAGAGGEVTAAREKLHRLLVDFFVTAVCVLFCRRRFGECGRVKNNKIVRRTAFFLKVGQKIENIGLKESHARKKTVQFRVMLRHGKRVGRHVHGRHRSGACGRGV